MTNKERYAAFCAEESSMPVFMQAWWMDGVCAGKQWDVMMWEDEEGNPAAALPYCSAKWLWKRYITMPQYTLYNGIWIREDKREDEAFLCKVADEAAAQLKAMPLWYYCQQYPVSSPMPELLKQRGFKVKPRMTYRIDDLSDLDQVLASFSKNKRRQLQKALTLHADTEMSAEDFYRFHDSCLREQNKKITYTREFLMVLYLKASRLGKCQILRICTNDGETAAAAFLVWDNQRMYYLIPCYSVRFKDSGAGALLVWEALKLARQQGVSFDFEGSMIRGVANHYKQFGSVATEYCSVRKYYNPLFAFALLYNKLKS